ncbi:MAG: hypothetical protein O6853_02705 [Actinobacteria bacterium]|nr:hypothetical protein [Actinomycetota bacterium]MCZ6518686.1 hypothetical protein [Actinomycetota bacterium]MCZ6567472.1 hypothetical protein [Actinomycetota bacterium]MCZ6629836.1 hypothetical protein [Actinomycetota bacterium]MCZ6736362.1 hypothetical protein [Actinomycetota bacterium]
MSPFSAAVRVSGLSKKYRRVRGLGDSHFSVFVSGADLSLTHAITITLGWSLVGLGLTWWGLQRRDA